MESQLSSLSTETQRNGADHHSLLCHHFSSDLQGQRQQERRSLQEVALLKWKASLADANSLSSEGNSTYCSWLGVTCDATGHVVELSLPSAGLRGQLDAFNFAVFPNLTKLNLNNNSLAGAIHNLCTNLMFLDLSRNCFFHGQIPESLAKMIPNLVYQYLNLSWNGFSLFRDNTKIAYAANKAPRTTTRIQCLQWRIPGDAHHNLHVAGPLIDE